MPANVAVAFAVYPALAGHTARAICETTISAAMLMASAAAALPRSGASGIRQSVVIICFG
jgi:hypothetical protein